MILAAATAGTGTGQIDTATATATDSDVTDTDTADTDTDADTDTTVSETDDDNVTDTTVTDIDDHVDPATVRDRRWETTDGVPVDPCQMVAAALIGRLRVIVVDGIIAAGRNASCSSERCPPDCSGHSDLPVGLPTPGCRPNVEMCLHGR